MAMVAGQLVPLTALLFCTIASARGDPSSASNLQWGRQPPPPPPSPTPTRHAVASATSLSPSSPLPSSSARGQRLSTGGSRTGPTRTSGTRSGLSRREAPTAVAGKTITTASVTTASSRRRNFQVQRRQLASGAASVTRTLLPFVPFLAEAPALTAQARAAWPWARAAATTAAAAAFARRPLAFVSPPTPPRYHFQQQQQQQRVQQRQQRHDATPRIKSCRERQHHSSPTQDEGDAMRGSFPFSSSSSPCPSSPPSHTRVAPHTSLSRRGAIKEALLSAARWATAGAMGSTVIGNGGASVVYAAEEEEGLRDLRGAKGDDGGGGGGGSGKDDDKFGSKAFAQKSYDGFAEGYDDLDGGWAASAIGVENLRSQLLSRATGRVLEVGVGTGLNLRHYRRDIVSAIDAVDLSPGMLRQASLRSESLGMKPLVKLSVMDVEHLGFSSEAFDTVVDTFSLCVFSDPSAALREMARVCKPEGRVLLLENSKSGFGPLASYQDLTASYLANKGGGKGCFWNQDVEALCRGVGLTVVRSSPALPGGVFRALECVPSRT
ncbi:unnamed protein product [Pylaiella littoralis]